METDSSCLAAFAAPRRETRTATTGFLYSRSSLPAALQENWQERGASPREGIDTRTALTRTHGTACAPSAAAFGPHPRQAEQGRRACV